MAEYLVWSGSGVTEVVSSTAYSLGDRIVIPKGSYTSNNVVARKYVWECTTAGTTGTWNDASPSYSASYTPDVSTITNGTAVFTCRNPGYSSGSTKDWTFATIYLSYATLRPDANGDIVKVHKAHTELWTTSSMSINLKFDMKIICVDKDDNDSRSEMTGEIATGSNYGIAISGDYLTPKLAYFYGIRLKSGTYNNLTIGSNMMASVEFDKCYFWVGDTVGGYLLYVGSSVGGTPQFIRFRNCKFRFGHTSHVMSFGVGRIVMEGCSIDSAGSAPATLIVDSAGPGGRSEFVGCDLSHFGSTGLIGNMNDGHHEFHFVNCKFPASFSWVGASQTYNGPNSFEIFASNCASGDTHYQFAYVQAHGSVEAVTNIYADDGALYDGTNHITWKITTTADCSPYNPFITPWIDKYHDATSAITPYLEILRDGSTTAYQDDEVWGEFSYQGTSGSTLATLVGDRGEHPPSLVSSPSDQAAGMGLGSWTGEGGSAWSGKLAPASAVTPAEIGFLRARVCVAEPSVVVYVDPTIRT